MMVIEAIKRAGGTDTTKIKDELAKTKEYQVVSGKITLNESHDAVKSAVIIEFKDGKQAFKESQSVIRRFVSGCTELSKDKTAQPIGYAPSCSLFCCSRFE